MKWFIDTNVWLSGLFGRGLCADLLAEYFGQGAELWLDVRVQAEIRRIALDKFKVDAARLALVERLISDHANVAAAAMEPTADIPDPDDAWIIAAALRIGATAFVTGDRALLQLGSVGTMPIIDPRSAYVRLKGLDG
ncbi:MAG: putative toxin-antitoxin system toxin component, PIN family [Xanthomonadales bacterium]|nr:putative toxin-antitoxin system toxin component, PIN family [Xanthomonadales bacterium]